MVNCVTGKYGAFLLFHNTSKANMTTIDQVVAANESLLAAIEQHQTFFQGKSHKSMSFALEQAGDDSEKESKKGIIARFMAFIKRIIDWFRNLRKKREDSGNDEATAAKTLEEKAKANTDAVVAACKKATKDAGKSPSEDPDKIGKETRDILNDIAKNSKQQPQSPAQPETKPEEKAPAPAAAQATQTEKPIEKKVDAISRFTISTAVASEVVTIEKEVIKKIVEKYNTNPSAGEMVLALSTNKLHQGFQDNLTNIRKAMHELNLLISSVDTWNSPSEKKVVIPEFTIEIQKKPLTEQELKGLDGTGVYYVARAIGVLNSGGVTNFRIMEKDFDARIEKLNLDRFADSPELVENIKNINESIAKVTALRSKVNQFLDKLISVAKHIVQCDEALTKALQSHSLMSEISDKIAKSITGAGEAEHKLVSEIVNKYALSYLSEHMLSRVKD